MEKENSGVNRPRDVQKEEAIVFSPKTSNLYRLREVNMFMENVLKDVEKIKGLKEGGQELTDQQTRLMNTPIKVIHQSAANYAAGKATLAKKLQQAKLKGLQVVTYKGQKYRVDV